jgi:hypothetical protein
MSLTKNALITTLILVILLLLVSYSTLRWGLSKDNIAYPAKDHAHFRIKYIFQGLEEDFGSPRYQTDYTKDICSGTLTTSPLHFHDNKTDYQHTHWTKMTGGQMLKFYGLNLIGGMDQYMGFKLDELPKVTPVPIHSNSLPKPRVNDKFFVYSGVEKDGKWEVTKKDWNNFVNQDLENFFGVESQVRKDEEKYGTKKSNLNFLGAIEAKAHSGEEHATLDEAKKHEMEVKERQLAEAKNNAVNTNSNSNINANSTQSSMQSVEPNGEELKSINNLLGDVVIFVQQDEPTKDQVEARFKNMIKLDKSACGG